MGPHFGTLAPRRSASMGESLPREASGRLLKGWADSTISGTSEGIDALRDVPKGFPVALAGAETRSLPGGVPNMLLRAVESLARASRPAAPAGVVLTSPARARARMPPRAAGAPPDGASPERGLGAGVPNGLEPPGRE